MIKYTSVTKVVLGAVFSVWSVQALAYDVTGNATLTSSTPGLSNNTTQSGISMTNGGDYTLTIDGDVNVSNNTGADPAGYGLLNNNGTLNFVGTDGIDTLTISGSALRGAHLNGGTTTTFTDMNLTIQDTVSNANALCAHGDLVFDGNGSNTLQLTGSTNGHGLHVYSNSGYTTAHTTINDMNVNATGNAIGIGLGGESSSVTAGRLDMTSASGNNTLNLSNNTMHGLAMGATKDVNTTAGAIANITNMNITANNNGERGIDVSGLSSGAESILTITGNGSNTLYVNNNGYEGINIGSKNNSAVIKNMNIQLNNNGHATASETSPASGFAVWGDVTIEGNGQNYIQMNQNERAGLAIANKTVGPAPKVIFTDMDITANNNGAQGIDISADDGAQGTSFEASSTHNNTLVANNNGMQGIRVSKNGSMTITGMNIQADGNGQQGMSVENSTMSITSTTGNNTMNLSNNGLEGLKFNNGQGTIANMNIIANNNGAPLTTGGANRAGGIYIIGKLDVQGNGSNVLQVNNNYVDGMAVDASSTGSHGLTVADMNVEVSGNKRYGIRAGKLAGGTIAPEQYGPTTATFSSVAGNNTLIVNSNDSGGFMVDAGSTLTISDMNVDVSNNSGAGIALLDSQGSITSSRNNNQLRLVDNTTSNILIQNNGNAYAKDAVLDINGMNIYSSGSVFATVSNSTIAYKSKLSMTNSKLVLGTTGEVFNLNKGNVDLTNVQQTGVNPTTLITNTGVSTFNAAQNTSVVGKITDTGRLTATLTDNSSWRLLDASNMYALTVTDSLVDLRHSTSGQYNTLTIGRNYNGTNATMYLNTNLDALNKTDQLVLSSGARVTGTTNLFVNDTSDASSYGTFIKGDGIKVVDAQGSATTGAGTFDLVGKKIDTGLYIQELYYQNIGMTDQSWYLRTATEDDGGGNKGSDGSYSNGDKPKATDLTKTVVAAPSMGLSLVKTINSELRTRLGELRSNDPRRLNGLWVRGFAKSLEVSEGIKSEMDIFGVEAGYDHLISRSAQHRTYLGLMAGYATADKGKITQHNGFRGKNEATAPSVGGYITWIKRNGWFVDGVMRAFFTKMDITNYSAQGQAIKYDAKRMYYTGSLEVGKRLPMYQSGRNGFILEPKAQVLYTFAPAKDYKTNLGQKIEFDDTHSLVTRAALQAAYRRTFANNMILEPFVQAGVAYEWMGKTDVRFIGTDFESDTKGAAFEGMLGLNARLTKMWHIYADLMIERGSVYKSFGGHLGTRLNF